MLSTINCINFVTSTNSQPENRQPVAFEVINRFGEEATEKIPVKQISLPDLSVPLQLGRRDPFSLFIPKHRKLAARLIDIFMGLFLLLTSRPSFTHILIAIALSKLINHILVQVKTHILS